MHPVVRHNFLAAWPSRIAGKQESRMRFGEDRAVKTLVEPCLIENSRLKIFGIRRYVGLPAQTWNHGQMRIGLPGILEIRADIALAGIPPNQGLLPELRRLSDQKIAQR